jgi:hypothetical protein
MASVEIMSKVSQFEHFLNCVIVHVTVLSLHMQTVSDWNLVEEGV